jgi:hypothetical protein
MPDLTVPVPDDRTAEFYQFFGLWLAGALSLTPSLPKGSKSPAAPVQPLAPWTGAPEDAADAEALWAKFSPNARGFFGLLIDNPGKKFTGDEAAQQVGIPNGAHGVAGVLAWPGRHCAPMGRMLPSSWEEDEQAGESYYFMTPAVAALFAAAREKVEGA